MCLREVTGSVSLPSESVAQSETGSKTEHEGSTLCSYVWLLMVTMVLSFCS